MQHVHTPSLLPELSGVIRREPRHKIALPIRVLHHAIADEGIANSVTYDVSLSGMRIHAVRGASIGDELIIERKGKRGIYSVAWLGTEDGKSLIGLRAKKGHCVWDADLLRLLGEQQEALTVVEGAANVSEERPRGIARVLDWFGQDRRNVARTFKSGVTVTYGVTPEEQSIAHVIEVTDSGLSFKSSANFSVGQVLRMFISVPRTQYAHVALRAEVRHCGSGVVGVRFLDVTSEKRKLIFERLVR